jgi:hypothetical protein
MKRLTAVGLAIFTASASFGAVSAISRTDEGPIPRPPWIANDGSLVASRAPMRISVGLPTELMAQSQDGWGWVDSVVFLRQPKVLSMPVYSSPESVVVLGYFDRRSGTVAINPDLKQTSEEPLTTDVQSAEETLVAT